MKFIENRRVLSMKLTHFIAQLDSNPEVDILDVVDAIVGAGYSNDGMTMDEVVDIGVQLEMERREYNPEAKIFCAYMDRECIMQFGLDEDDAIRRIMDKL